MHPIERLRYVARSQGAPADLLVRESAMALGAFRDDPAGLVSACRRIIDRQLTCAPLWWLCARMLCAPDPMAEGHRAVLELEDDPTARVLAEAIPADATIAIVGWPEQVAGALRRRGDVEVLVVDVDGEAGEAVGQLEVLDVEAVEVPARNLAAAVRVADLVVIDSLAVGPSHILAAAGSCAAAATARHLEVPVWVVAGVGRLMPASMHDAMVRRWELGADALEATEETMTIDLADRLVVRDGVVEVREGLARTDCPVAPELFRLAG